MKPAPERTFSHWYAGERELSRPAVRSTYADSIIAAADQPIISIKIFKVVLPSHGAYSERLGVLSGTLGPVASRVCAGRQPL